MLAKQRSAPDRKRETAEEAKLREAVMSEVLDIKPSESWNDIAGLDGAKQVTFILAAVYSKGNSLINHVKHTPYTMHTSSQLSNA